MRTKYVKVIVIYGVYEILWKSTKIHGRVVNICWEYLYNTFILSMFYYIEVKIGGNEWNYVENR